MALISPGSADGMDVSFCSNKANLPFLGTETMRNMSTSHSSDWIFM